MMKRLSISMLLVGFCLGGAALADWRFYILDSLYLAGANVDPHPDAARVMVASSLPENPLGAFVCGFYINNFEQRGKGRFILRGEVIRADGTRESFRKRGRVRRNEGEACVGLTAFGHDDLIALEWEFLNFPDLTREGPNDSDPDRFVISSLVVSQSGGPSQPASEVIDTYRQRLVRRFEEGLL